MPRPPSSGVPRDLRRCVTVDGPLELTADEVLVAHRLREHGRGVRGRPDVPAPDRTGRSAPPRIEQTLDREAVGEGKDHHGGLLVGHAQVEGASAAATTEPDQIRGASLDSAATWRSGYAAACKAVYTGSIPVVASTGFAAILARGENTRSVMPNAKPVTEVLSSSGVGFAR